MRFKIDKLVGEGAFGKVYRAIDLMDGQLVALKELNFEFQNWEECLTLYEIQALQSISHPNIVKLKEVLLQGNKLSLAYELLDMDLEQMTSEKRKRKESFTKIEVTEIMYQLLKGIAYLHRHGYFHRDLKPENILMGKGTILKITDFGLVKKQNAPLPFT